MSVASTIWSFFKGKGLNDFAIAGIMGNLNAESALKPTNLQNSYQSKLGYTDDTYTAAVDSGAYTNFVKDCAGYGLAQWTYWSRKQALLDYARSLGKSIGDLTMQLEFMWKEMQGYKSMMTTLKTATSILEASNAVLTQYERPANMGESVQKTRAGYGQTYYNEFAGTSGNQYRVAVSDHTDLDSAKKQLATVQAKGFTAMVTQDGNIYVVQTGAYSACCNANEQLDRVKAAGFTDAYVTTKPAGNVVATAPDKTEDEPVKEPVKVETPTGKYDPAKVIAVAMEEVGYLEKETNSQLDSDTANAGDANYTKFARDLDNLGFYNGRKNGYAWCDVFVDWCFVTAYGMAAALALTFQPTKAANNCGAGCKYSRQYYQNNGRLFDTPQPGDQIFFYSSDKTTISHTGLVYAVDKTYVYTVEGNTSSASGVVANGGAVNKKKYRLNYDRLAGYGRPAYDVEYKADSTPATKYTLGSRTLKVTSPYMKGDDVTELQTRLNALGFDCGTVDGEYGKNTEQGVRAFQTAAKIEVDGKFGAESFAALNAYKGSEDSTTGSYITYEVKEKDTLWGIAQRFLGNGADWTKIAKLNGITGTIIHAGQQLKIPE